MFSVNLASSPPPSSLRLSDVGPGAYAALGTQHSMRRSPAYESLSGPRAGCQVVHVVLECYRRLYKCSCNGSEWHPVKVEPLESSVADETVSYVSCVSGQLEANESPNPMLSYLWHEKILRCGRTGRQDGGVSGADLLLGVPVAIMHMS